jgi:hypothetical protein
MIPGQDGITNILLSMGFPGVVILIQAWSIYKLFGINQTLQESRIAEMKTVTETMAASTSALNEIAKIVEKGFSK